MKQLLDKTARRVVRLHQDEGWSVQNIHTLTGLPASTIRQVLINQGIEPLM